MKKIIKRLLAYLIDIFIVSIVASCIMYIPFINKDNDNYKTYYASYNELYTNYTGFSSKLKKYYEDNKLSSNEYEKLVSKYEDYKDVIDKYYKDGQLTKSNYNKLSDEVDKSFQKEYKSVYYKLSKYSVISNIIQVILILVYFVGINLFTKGQTIGKKILKLKIVNNKDRDSEVSFMAYVIRVLVLYNPIYYLALVIGVYMFSVEEFYNWTLVWSNIKNYLEIIIIIMIIIRADGRGLHDLLANTRVIALDEIDDLKANDKIIINENNGENKDEEEVLLIKNDNANVSPKRVRKRKKVIVTNEDKEEK